jgi:hypothetical protein
MKPEGAFAGHPLLLAVIGGCTATRAAFCPYLAIETASLVALGFRHVCLMGIRTVLSSYPSKTASRIRPPLLLFSFIDCCICHNAPSVKLTPQPFRSLSISVYGAHVFLFIVESIKNVRISEPSEPSIPGYTTPVWARRKHCKLRSSAFRRGGIPQRGCTS